VRAALQRYGIQLALVAVAVVWGSTFVMVKDAVSDYPLYAFLGLRFAIAVVAFMMLFPRAIGRLTWPTVRIGLLAGVFLTAGYIFQTWGLQGTTASKAAFITGMFVVFTPILQTVLLRRMPRAATILGVVAAVVGLWLLSGGGGGSWTAGDTRVLLCALAYSGHLIVLGSVPSHHDVGALTLAQLATVAIACICISLAVEQAGLPDTAGVWVALLVTGVLASAVAFAVQTYAQRYIPPARTALILITEPAFGGLFGWLAGEALGLQGLAGAALILAGMIVSELVGARAPKEDHVALDPSLEGIPVPVIEATEEGIARSR
jgi:drug/metabolite transporter (DMT)-like permease